MAQAVETTLETKSEDVEANGDIDITDVNKIKWKLRPKEAEAIEHFRTQPFASELPDYVWKLPPFIQAFTLLYVNLVQPKIGPDGKPSYPLGENILEGYEAMGVTGIDINAIRGLLGFEDEKSDQPTLSNEWKLKIEPFGTGRPYAVTRIAEDYVYEFDFELVAPEDTALPKHLIEKTLQYNGRYEQREKGKLTEWSHKTKDLVFQAKADHGSFGQLDPKRPSKTAVGINVNTNIFSGGVDHYGFSCHENFPIIKVEFDHAPHEVVLQKQMVKCCIKQIHKEPRMLRYWSFFILVVLIHEFYGHLLVRLQIRRLTPSLGGLNDESGDIMEKFVFKCGTELRRLKPADDILVNGVRLFHFKVSALFIHFYGQGVVAPHLAPVVGSPKTANESDVILYPVLDNYAIRIFGPDFAGYPQYESLRVTKNDYAHGPKSGELHVDTAYLTEHFKKNGSYMGGTLDIDDWVLELLCGKCGCNEHLSPIQQLNQMFQLGLDI